MARYGMVVLGAGPAGTAAAITAAARGIEAVIVEQDEFPRFRPGEALHPGTLPLFRTLGVDREILAAGFLRFRGVWLEQGSTSRFEPFSTKQGEDWFGFQAWRETLDSILLARARQVGVTVLQPCRATGVLRSSDGAVRGVVTGAGELEAEWVVDATGSNRWVARQLELPTRLHSPNQWVQYGYVEGAAGEPRFTWDSDGRWRWHAQVREGVVQWASLLKEGDDARSDHRPAFLAGRRDIRPAAVTAATWLTMQQMAGPGFFLTGDAAGSLDPSSGHGVLRALMSGMMAAHLASQSNRQADEVAGHYDQWLGAWFTSDRTELTERLTTKPASAIP